MATSTYLSNPTVEIGSSSASTTDITDQVTACVVNSNLGELAVYEIELIQGQYTADITP